MLIRRRKVTIEIERKTVRMEVTSGTPAVPGATTNEVPTAEPIDTPLPGNLVSDVVQEPEPSDNSPHTFLFSPVDKDLQ